MQAVKTLKGSGWLNSTKEHRVMQVQAICCGALSLLEPGERMSQNCKWSEKLLVQRSEILE